MLFYLNFLNVLDNMTDWLLPVCLLLAWVFRQFIQLDRLLSLPTKQLIHMLLSILRRRICTRKRNQANKNTEQRRRRKTILELLRLWQLQPTNHPSIHIFAYWMTNTIVGHKSRGILLSVCLRFLLCCLSVMFLFHFWWFHHFRVHGLFLIVVVFVAVDTVLSSLLDYKNIVKYLQ